jgi:hypothetical protein
MLTLFILGTVALLVAASVAVAIWLIYTYVPIWLSGDKGE